MTPSNRSLRRQAGMTLIEVLVAILVLSFGLLGFVGLQARAIQFSTSAEDTNRAALLANEITSAMALAQTVNLPSATITAWQLRVADPAVGFASGVGTVTNTSVSAATITVRWVPTSATNPASAVPSQFVTQFVLP